VVAPLDCATLAEQPWGEGQWENWACNSGDNCEGDPWDDWSQQDPCTQSDPLRINRQEPGVLGVHAMHLPGGKVMLWEGRYDQQAWDIYENTWEWYPLTSAAQEIAVQTCYPGAIIDENLPVAMDLFCAGSTLDGDGNIIAAGGNLTSNSQIGSRCSYGLAADDYITGAGAVDPAEGNLCPGEDVWVTVEDEPSTSPWQDAGFTNISIPRWYPTLTTLPSGDVIMAGGEAQNAVGTSMELFEGSFGWTDVSEVGPGELYPFMFVTPQGDLLYAGAETLPDDDDPGSIFRLGDDGTWSVEAEVSSPVRGGSAVMYSPGQVMKSGGGSRPRCARVEGPPLATTAVIDTANLEAGFVDTGSPMNRRRHFHTLTVLADGRVLATAGNSCGNGVPGTSENSCFADAQTFDECEEGDDGCIPVTSIPCQAASECPEWATCGSADVPDCVEGGAGEEDCTCNPLNNACYAVREAELWDPETQEWCVMAEQSFERMYHSTALLMPDGRVMSTGNGRRSGLVSQKNTEFFSPPYLLDGAVRPVVDGINGQVPSRTEFPYLRYGEEVSIELSAGGPTFAEIGRVTLVRLGSVTHQFDMNQRFLDLGCFWENGGSGADSSGGSGTPGALIVNGPLDANIAPPGHYMLFVLTESGTPSEAVYVQVGE
jgi:hypothetical protein